MARLALIPIALFPLWAACGSTSGNRFVEPNSIMGPEIENRVAEIQYQHREELYANLLWLVQAGEQAIPTLLEGLHHTDPKVRSNCAWVLAQIGDRRVIEDLQPMVHDVNQTVRLEVARTLVLLGDTKNCPPLIDALDSDKVQVRYLCHEALKFATGQDFGYDHLSDDLAQRQRSVLKWREWWSEVSGDPWFAQTYATEHGLGAPPAETPVTPPAPMLEPSQGQQGGDDATSWPQDEPTEWTTTEPETPMEETTTWPTTQPETGTGTTPWTTPESESSTPPAETESSPWTPRPVTPESHTTPPLPTSGNTPPKG